MEEMSSLIKLFSWNYLDMDSLYAPVEGKKSFQPQELEAPEIDEEERERKRLKMREKLDRILSQDKIDAWVLEQLKDRDSVMASELAESDDHFIRLIYVRLYGTRKRMSYLLRLGSQINRNGYRFRDFEIIRR